MDVVFSASKVFAMAVVVLVFLIIILHVLYFDLK